MTPSDIASDLDKMSFTSGVRRSDRLAYLSAVADRLAETNEPHCRIIAFDANYVGGFDLPYSVVSVGIVRHPAERFITLSEEGFIHVVGGGEKVEEPPVRDASSPDLCPERRGPLREVRGIRDGRVLAVGTARQAYRRNGPGHWECIDQSAQDPAIDLTEKSFESVDGFAEDDIYAVGWDGEIWHYDGRVWVQKDSPTNLALYKVRCADDGIVYACGQDGVLIRGRDDRWEVVGEDTTSEDLWGLEFFEGTLYVSSLHLLYTLDGRDLVDLDWGDTLPPTSCYHLSAAGGLLWSIGAKDVMEFDGQQWRSVF